MLKWPWRKALADKALSSTASGPSADLLAAIAVQVTAANWQDARTQLDTAFKEWPDHPELLLLSARCYRQALQPARALEACENALSASDDPSTVQHEIALNRLLLPDLPGALEALEVAVALREDNGDAWLTLGETLNRLDRDPEALEALEHAVATLRVDTDLTRAHFLYGQQLLVANRLDEARQAFETAQRLDPGFTEVHIGLGNVALWQDRDPEAVYHYQQAIQKTTRPSRSLQLNLGSALQNCGRFEEARILHQRVLAEQPNDHVTRWYVCQMDLALCDWQAGWSKYGSRFGAGAVIFRPMPYRPWDGRPLPSETLLILADEGIGDEIMYASCLADAAQQAQHLIVECEPRLERLFRRSFPYAHVVGTRRENTSAWLDGLPVPTWQVASGDLPGFFRTRDAAFPQHTGYLSADPERVTYWRDRLERELGPRLKVGISWRGGLPKTRSRARSIDTAHWAPILGLADANFVNLQYGAYETELAALNAEHGPRITDFPEAIRDYDETAALVAALDVVVTVCTAIVHLAGALGKPVWVLTPLSPGWRYTAQRDQMPWYPSSRIYRQQAWGDWAEPCQILAADLAKLTQSVTPRPYPVNE